MAQRAPLLAAFGVILAVARANAAPPESVTAVRDAYPTLSPDGKTLLFVSNRSGVQALWTASADGSGVKLWFEHGDGAPTTPAWSPDGKTVAFAMRPDGAAEDESDIFTLDAGGRTLRRLTDAPGDDSHPHWSADGKRIFFNSPRATPNLKAPWNEQQFGIYSVGIDGSGLRRHFQCDTVCTYPVPSPDGKHIAFRKVLKREGFDWEQKSVASDSEVFVADMDGTHQRNLSNDPHFDGWPVWSRDGRSIVFASARDGQPRAAQLFRVYLDDGRIERLTAADGFSRAQPSVAADGTIWFYESRENERTEIGHVAKIPTPGR